LRGLPAKLDPSVTIEAINPRGAILFGNVPGNA
jgi:hypothetical protein